MPLIYHFDGRHDLLRAVLGQMFGRLRETRRTAAVARLRRVEATDWLSPLEDGLRGSGRPEPATLVLAVIRGLLMDLDATGDTARTDRAFDDFIGALEHLPVLRGG